MTAAVLMKQSLQTAFKGFARSQHLETDQHKIGKLDAVTVHGQVTDPKKGSYLIELTGILNPDGPKRVLAFSMINTATSEVKTIEHPRTDGIANKVIHSIKFTPQVPTKD